MSLKKRLGQAGNKKSNRTSESPEWSMGKGAHSTQSQLGVVGGVSERLAGRGRRLTLKVS